MASSPFESLIPAVQPRWKRTVATGKSLVSSSEKECQVCLKERSNYCCPKCSIQYCSLACYKSHGEICTESFYQKQVTQELELECKDDAIQEILKRVHEQQSEEQNIDQFSIDELERMQEALERGEQIEISPEMQAAFERDVQSGQLNHVVKPWSPWWGSSLLGEIDDNDDEKVGPGLDERLLQIARFSKLSSKEAPPCLAFNLVSILHAITHTLRLYGGHDNALCLEAAETLVSQSPVLSKDVRYDSLQQVLMEHGSSDGDVVALLVNQRHVAHALFDGMDILKAAQKETNDRQRLKMIRKKLEFYLSWSRRVDFQTLSATIQTWQDEWKLNDELQTLKLA
jgi:hypothetical protein